MRKTLRSMPAGIAALLFYHPAGAADVWDAPAFSVPASQLLQAAKAIKRERVTDVVVLLDERLIVVDEQQRSTRTMRLIYRIDSASAVDGWSATTAQWQPWYQAKPAIRVRVISADGSEHQVDQALLSDAASHEGDDQIFGDSRTIRGPLPAVAVGAVIEEEITIRDEKPFFTGGVVSQEFIGRNVPVMRTRIAIEAPQSLPLKFLTQALPTAQAKESRVAGRVRWTLEQGELDAVTDFESNVPPDVPLWPSVRYSSSVSWEAVAAAYREMVEARVRIDDAKPLLAGLKTPLPNSPTRDYIAAVVERIHREVRYTGVEFGEARLIPAFPAETLRRKFGDCKDKSTLLVAALRASGIDAYLALLSAGDGQDVSPDLPGLGMFDHAIVYVPGTPDLWIDPTAEYTRVGTLPALDAGRLALVIRAGEKTLMRTPEMRSADNREVQTREIFLGEYGPSRAIETTEVFGTIEDEYRNWYAGADTKERRESLTKYAERNYRAKALTSYVHTSSTDFSKPYSLRLEIKDANVGATDLAVATVRIRVSNIASRLPDVFGTLLKEDNEDDDGFKPRKSDVVFEPFVTEWRYRIHPPPGYQSQKLPGDSVLPLGPAQLSSEFKLAADGAVQATWRFDTVKSRYTPAESEALARALRELRRKETTRVTFDQVSVALSNEGKFKEALQANEALAAKNPRKAVYRLHSAAALLKAGLGTHAQREALAATRLEPKSALAWKTLGWSLQHDTVGRRFGDGYDRAGAIAAYRKARALAPEDTDIAADLAVLLEFDAYGARYSPRTNLDEAIKIYKERRALMSEEEARSDGYGGNLHYALLYTRRFSELRGLLRDLPQNANNRMLLLAATAGESGSATALELARSQGGEEKERLTALSSAANLLLRMREYSLSADLLEAGSSGEANNAAITQRIALLRKTRRDDGRSNPTTDPRGFTLRWFADVLAEWTSGVSVGARDNRYFVPGNEIASDDAGYVAARRSMVAALARQDIPGEVATDLLFSHARINVDGDDARGYRVQMRTPASTQSIYVVSMDGAYRILTMAPDLGPLATRALQRADANDLAGARQWLDWARAEVKPGSGDDPLAGPSFPRAWTVGAEADLAAARIAAALLLVDNARSELAIPTLLKARGAATSATDKLNIDHGLARAHVELQQWPELLEVSTRLVAAMPASSLAFRQQQMAYVHLKQWDAAEAAARARLARLPDDSLAREMLFYQAEERGAFGELRKIMQPVFDSGRATAFDYNQYAWSSLLRRPIDEDAVEAARNAYDESQGKSYAISHTLACVYAATGKPREARDLLLKGMDQIFLGSPNDENWYGFGLIAEAYGDAQSAREYYANVKKPKKGAIESTSVYALSQARLAALSINTN